MEAESSVAPRDVPGWVAALADRDAERREAAAYALSWSDDKRAVSPLIQVLANLEETPEIRGQAAEGLGVLGRRRAIKALIRHSSDESVDLRFWCVFALGQYSGCCGERRLPGVVIRALEARLTDSGHIEDYWCVGLEALAILQFSRQRHPTAPIYRQTILAALRNPLGHRDEWQWASWYGDHTFPDLYRKSLRAIRQAGFDPNSFGREND